MSLAQISAIIKGSSNRHGFPENVSGFLGVPGATEVNPVTGADDGTLQKASDAIAYGILTALGGEYVLYSSNISDFAETITAFGSNYGTIYINSQVPITNNLDIATLAPNVSIVGMRGGGFVISATKTINFKSFDSFGLSLSDMFSGAGAFTFAYPVRLTGAGSPESIVTAPVGSEYLRSDGGAAATLYVKESGSGNTGWVASATSGSISGCLILSPDSSVRNRIQPTNPAYIPLTIRGAASQSAALFLVENSAGSPLLTLDASGALTVAGVISGSNLSGTNTGDQTIILTGDVTGSGTGSFAASIGVNKVTLSMMAQVPSESFLGRDTDGTGNVELLSVAAVKLLLNLAGNNSGDQTITLTGGVTGSGTGSFATTVITNANLTGPITSVGNATSVASQTGTGSTFVMSASPTGTGTWALPTVTVGGTLSVTGDFIVNTNKFTVSASTGNTFASGTLYTGNTTTGAVFTLEGVTGVSNAYIFDTSSTAGTLDIRINSGVDRFVSLKNNGAGNLNLAVDGTIHAPVFTNSLSWVTATFNAESTGGTYFIGRDGATIKYSMAPTLFTVVPNIALAGRLNINGAVDSTAAQLNILTGNIGVTRTSGSGGLFSAFGVGAPGDADSEFLRLLHDGASHAKIQVNKSGTGTYRDLLIQTSGVTAIIVAASQAVTLSSTLTVTGITTLNGLVGIGGNSASNVGFNQVNTGMTSTNQTGIQAGSVFQTSATGSGYALDARLKTVASAFTMSVGVGVRIDTPLIGVGSAVTTNYGLYIDDQTGGGTNYAIKTGIGQVSIGDIVSIGSAAPSTSHGLKLNLTTLTGVSQYQLVAQGTSTSAATSSTVGLYSGTGTSANAYTCASVIGVQIDTPSKGSGSTITTAYGLKIENQTVGTNNFAIKTGSGIIDVGDRIQRSISGEFLIQNTNSAGGSSGGVRLYTSSGDIKLEATGSLLLSSTTGTLGFTGATTLTGSALITTTLQVNGIITAGSHIQLSMVTLGGAAGRIYSDTSHGMVLYGSAGSVNNFLLSNSSGQTIFLVPTGGKSVFFQEDITVTRDLFVFGSVKKSYSSGITASTTQSQGQMPLTKDINRVTSVANSGDVVTMPSAVAGMVIHVQNETSNTNSLQIFPASGDEFYYAGNADGVDISFFLQHKCTAIFSCSSSSIWHIVATFF